MRLTTQYWSGFSTGTRVVAEVRANWHATNRRDYLTGLLAQFIQFNQSYGDSQPTTYRFFAVPDAIKFANAFKTIVKPNEATLLKPGEQPQPQAAPAVKQ
jgi:hypothetical protein